MTLRYGAVALVELDGESHELPGRIRRWPVHWNDLLVEPTVAAPQEPLTPYGTGVPVSHPERQRHAARLSDAQALCGEPICLLTIGDWLIPFMPTLSDTCTDCVRRVQEAAAHTSP
jgi:hypothetical protein